jgi:outer membrane protein assembly factor BamB
MAGPPEEPPDGPPEEPPHGRAEEPPHRPPEEPPHRPSEEPAGPAEEPPHGLADEPWDEPAYDLADEPSEEPAHELTDDLWEELEIHTPEEIAQRRAEERAAHRRVGRQRLLVLIVGVVALIVIIVLVTGTGGGSPNVAKRTTPAATKAAKAGVGPGHLAAGSTAAVVPANILIADRNNNRLLAVTPKGQVVWTSAELSPSDAYFSSSGRSVVVTQHLRAVVVLRGVDSGRIDYTYGHANSPGSGNNRLRDPQTGQLTKTGRLVIADLGNCRVLFVGTKSHRPVRVLGTGSCVHNPPTSFAGPDAAFPTPEGGIVVTERNPGWVDVLSKTYALTKSIRLATFSAPYDANEYAPGQLIVTDRTRPGTVEELDAATGKATWTYRQTSGPGELNLPTLAKVLPNGDVIVADSGNDRVIVIDPKTKAIVWQYGHTAKLGTADGYLHTPDSVDLVP